MTKRLDLDAALALAGPVVQAHLATLPPLPEAWADRVMWGAGESADVWEIDLYLPGERPEEGTVLLESTVSRSTGEVELVAYPDRWAGAS